MQIPLECYLLRLVEELNPSSKFSEIKELLSNKKTLISLIIIIILILGLAVGLYLIKNPKIFKSKASEKKVNITLENSNKSQGYIIEFKDPSVVEKNTKTVGKGKLSPKAAESYTNSTLKPVHEAAKKDIFARLSTSGSRKSLSQVKKPAILGEYFNAFNGIALDITNEQVEKVKQSPFVKAVYPNLEVKVNLNVSVPLIGADKVWNVKDDNGQNITGKGVNVAVLDTGVDYTHPDLGGCLGKGCKVVDGYDFVNNDNDPLDDHGHGTHVTSTIAGLPPSGSPSASLIGVAPGANIIAYKVLDRGGVGLWSDVFAAIDKAVTTRLDSDSQNDIGVINMSLGLDCSYFYGEYTSYCGPDDPASRVVDNAVDAGIVTVIGAGNSGPDSGTIGSPGTARKAITVGAVDKNKQLTLFSSRGPVIYNGETINKPDIVAPGASICAAEWDSWLGFGKCVDDKHVLSGGTSMATPHVSGVVALMKQANPSLLPAQIKEIIKANAQNLNLPADFQGKGLIDTLKSVTAASCKECPIPTPTPITPTPTPSPTPTPDPNATRVFVTSTYYNGNLGGLSGADAKCQERADAVNLGGTWKAWLSDSTTSVSSRLNHNNGSYVLLDGKVIADNWADLVDGNIKRQIGITEYKNYYVQLVWTGSLINGVGGTDNCQNWTSSEAAASGISGFSKSNNEQWTKYSYAFPCNRDEGLYCFEQAPAPTSTPTPFVCTACAADIYKDARNQINASDYSVLSTCYNQPLSKTLSGARTCEIADINKDGAVNQDDYTCLKSVYFQRCQP